MNDCPQCGYPLTWSTDRERVWCSLYGDHGAALAPANVIQLRPRPAALMLAADAELHGAPSEARGGKIIRRLKAVS